ncbi:MerR family transcriptional regulator [Actinophytocola algeriensis]|uniref:DNA-binding transcriptional MerR regulator n=1 Tax=Actinophytocola algeriensis TaxID=1768010 RepID=A0A7W7Q0Z9_9PSEU|nr:MerR family transcriptional regulator [Actinophytocola algeriensis]MBB4904853.1 DNA-binding transcriptional MerR regulator [Actinophytocola algeriensis]MBE1476288.1 DNA-binding transcriptional MerR regulator [Actinophytocola algeriensis]
MRIGELAERTGVSVRALRYYEEQKLLRSDRSPSGQRHYGQDAVERVLRIQQLYSAGLSSKTVLTLMPCLESGEVRPEVLDLLESERARIDRQLQDLLSTRDQLDTAIATSRASMAGVPCPRLKAQEPRDRGRTAPV